jgi:tRNA U34 5-carboxymethylaminomethyl modifying GTPase MnmE/TrmE
MRRATGVDGATPSTRVQSNQECTWHGADPTDGESGKQAFRSVPSPALLSIFGFSRFRRGRFPACMKAMNQNEATIVALATPAGTAAIALVRVSGPLCRVWAEGALFGRHLPDRRACHLDYRAMAGQVMDDVVVVAYRAPASYTGEDALEISCHGNPFIVRRLVEDLCARGARPALPGEFTQRAFLSGRLDLSQAEAVMDLIQARSDRSLAVAQQQLKGSLGRHLAPLQSQLLEAAAWVEAYIDFPDEDLPQEDRERVTLQLETVLRGTRRLLGDAALRSGVARGPAYGDCRGAQCREELPAQSPGRV